MFLERKITNFVEIREILLDNNVILFLDTNIVIDLYDLLRNPIKYKNTNGSKELIDFAKFKIENNINFYPLTGIWESNKLINNNILKEKRQNIMKETLINYLNTDLLTFFKHINSNIIISEENYSLQYPNSNIRLIFTNDEIKEILLLKYCCLLKLYLLLMEEENYLTRIKLFIDYLFDDIGINDVGSFIVALKINNSKNRKLFFHKMEPKYPKIIKNIFSASFDLSIIEYSHSVYKDIFCPIFVTKDKILYEICETMKIVSFQNNFPIKKINFSSENYNEEIFNYYLIRSNKRLKKNETTEFLWSKAKNLEGEIFEKSKKWANFA